MITPEEVRRAAARLAGVAVRTPCLRSEVLGDMVGAELFLKAESLQRTGSFKIRGAFNRIACLTPEERARGVICASAGNHAQGVALAARLVGVRATVVMPEGAALPKVVATRRQGAEVILAGATYDAAYERARELERERGMVFVHAFDDPLVVAGQGTVGLEIAEDVGDVDAVVVPVGGGGLITGIAVAVKSVRPGVRVVGVQAAGAPALYRSLAAGRPVELPASRTIADGLAVKRPLASTFEAIRRWVDEVVLVEEDEIAWAMLALLEQARLVAEGAGAAGVAALLAGRLGPLPRRVVAVVSGGNVDVTLLDRVIQRGLVREGRQTRLATRVWDQPGALQELLRVVASVRGNVMAVEHDRLRPGTPLGEVGVTLLLETRDRTHVVEIVRALEGAGYPVEELPL